MRTAGILLVGAAAGAILAGILASHGLLAAVLVVSVIFLAGGAIMWDQGRKIP